MSSLVSSGFPAVGEEPLVLVTNFHAFLFYISLYRRVYPRFRCDVAWWTSSRLGSRRLGSGVVRVGLERLYPLGGLRGL